MKTSQIIAIAGSVLVLSAAATAEAQNTRLTRRDIDQVSARLQSDSADDVREAIDQLTEIDHADVVPPLARMLRAGQPDATTDRALVALRQLAYPASIEVLNEFTQHRRPGARRRAYQALAAISDRRIPGLVAQGLRDSDRSVRAASALALGDLGARDSLDLLFRAFDRGVIEAAIAIGRLGNASHLERFDGYLGEKPLSVMLSGYDEFLKRSDISLETKEGIVTRLGEVSGPMVRRFLQQYLARFDERGRAGQALRVTVEQTLRRIPEDS